MTPTEKKAIWIGIAAGTLAMAVSPAFKLAVGFIVMLAVTIAADLYLETRPRTLATSK